MLIWGESPAVACWVKGDENGRYGVCVCVMMMMMIMDPLLAMSISYC